MPYPDTPCIHSASRTKPPARSVCVCLGVCAFVCLGLSACLVRAGHTEEHTHDVNSLSRSVWVSVCLSVCLPGWLAGCWLAGWLAGWLCLSVFVSVCLSGSVWVCLGLDLSGSGLSLSVSVSVSKNTCDCSPQKTSKTTCSIPFTSSSRTGHTTEHIHDINRTVSRGLPRRLRFLRCPKCSLPGRHNRHRMYIVQCPLACRDVCDVNNAICPSLHNLHRQRLVQFSKTLKKKAQHF